MSHFWLKAVKIAKSKHQQYLYSLLDVMVISTHEGVYTVFVIACTPDSGHKIFFNVTSSSTNSSGCYGYKTPFITRNSITADLSRYYHPKASPQVGDILSVSLDHQNTVYFEASFLEIAGYQLHSDGVSGTLFLGGYINAHFTIRAERHHWLARIIPRNFLSE